MDRTLSAILQPAREHAEMNDFFTAFHLYFDYFSSDKIDSENSPVIDQIQFAKVLQKLISSYDEEVALAYAMSSLRCLPQNSYILNLTGSMLFRIGSLDEAKNHLYDAIRLGSLAAEKNYLHILWSEVPRWHFRMLNDSVRNRSYANAIKKAISSDKCKAVVDIGAGCGLLTLIAATNQEKGRVTAFEESKTMFNIADDVVKAYKGEKCEVDLRHELSTDYSGEPLFCDLIVTEIFDVALFGEGALTSISHAINTFAKEEFTIIPARATLYVTGIESAKFNSKFQLTNNNLSELGFRDGCVRAIRTETYDGENLSKNNVRYLTTTASFLSVCFSDKDQLKLLLENSSCIPEIELECSEQGTLHGLGVWFDLHLDEDEAITTDPNVQSVKCWEQAAFSLDHSVDLKKGELLKLKPLIKHEQLSFELTSHVKKCTSHRSLSQDSIVLLNDTNYVSAVKKAVDGFSRYDLTVLDLNSSCPLFGILMGQRGSKSYCVFKEESDLVLFRRLSNENGYSNVNFIDEDDLSTSDMCFKTADVVFMDLVDTDGTWNGSSLDDCALSQFKENAEFLPKTVKLKAQLIKSAYVDFCNKVDDNNAFNFGIAEHVNRYMGWEHPNIETLDYDPLSTIIEFDISDLEETHFHGDVVISKEEVPNAILFWFDLQITEASNTGFSTKEDGRYCKACSLVKSPRLLKKDETVTVIVQRDEDYMKIYCEQLTCD